MQADPILYAGGMNLYAYVGNDPINFTDPWGLDHQLCTSIDNGVRYCVPGSHSFGIGPFRFGGSGGFGFGFGDRGGDGGDEGGGDDESCDAPLPDGSTVRENVAFVENIIFNSPRDPEGMDVPYLVAGGYVLGAVSPGGAWDYKIQPGSTGDEMGNFNFGAVGSLFLPGEILAGGAGMLQTIQHLVDPQSHPQPPEWLEPPNVGDDPRDTEQIMQGDGKCRRD